MADVPMMKNTGAEVPQMYTDGISQVHVVADMVRMDLFTQVPAGPDRVEPIITGRLIMTIPAYLQMFELMRDITNKLVANGTIEEQK